MLLATLAFVFLAFALLALAFATVTALCLLVGLSLIVGFALRFTRFAWLSPFFIWIPCLAATFSVLFFGYTGLAWHYYWPLPNGLLQFLILFILGEMFSIGLGALIALRSRKQLTPKSSAPITSHSNPSPPDERHLPPSPSREKD